MQFHFGAITASYPKDELRKPVSLPIPSKVMKYLGITITKRVKGIQNHNIIEVN